MQWLPLWLTFKLAFVTTVILFVLSLPLAYWLAFSSSRFKSLVESIVTMPLVLPPIVIGFYLLLFLGQNSFFGQWLWSWFSLRLVFTFEGLVFASLIYSLPFMVNPLQSGFQSVPVSLVEASYTLGKSKRQTLFSVLLPNMKPAVITALVLSFAHTVGEFGIVLMIGGSIPGETKVASIAIYDEVQALNYSQAHAYAFALLLLTFSILWLVHFLNAKNEA